MAMGGDSLADQDLWTHQAVSQIMLANSLLRSIPQIDTEHIGITGISWGGYLTCIAGSVDDRFKIAIPVYGCGFMYESPQYMQLLEKKVAISKRWIQTCDPSLYLPDAKASFLWLTGTNDKHFTLDTFRKSRLLVSSPQTAAIRIAMTHSHTAGWQPPEIYAFADDKLKQLPSTLVQGYDYKQTQGQIQSRYQPAVACDKAQLVYTTSTNSDWRQRPWESIDAMVNKSQRVVTATVPANTSACFLNLLSPRGLITSMPLMVLRESTPVTPVADTALEDFENRSVGDGVSGSVVAAGTSIKITNKVSQSGKHALAFTDAPAKQGWLPMRQHWFKGKDQIDSGIVELSFDLMQAPDQTGRFYIQLRDYKNNQYVNGLSIDIDDLGQVTINKQNAMHIKPGQWCHFNATINMTDGQGQCVQTTEQGTETYSLNTEGFNKINWLGYVSAGNTKAVTYLDNVKFAVKTQTQQSKTSTKPLSKTNVEITNHAQSFDQRYDFEDLPVGKSVTGVQASSGSSVLVTDVVSATGKKSLAFTDAKSNQSWLPMLQRWFKGDQQLTTGTFQIQFDLMQNPESPGKFYLHLRDYNDTKYVNGIALQIDQQGHTILNSHAIETIFPGQWCHFEIQLNLDQGTATCKQAIGDSSKTHELKMNSFKKLSWYGFVANDNQTAITYLDNLSVRYDPSK